MTSFEIVRCLCNHMENPLGIDSEPIFSWRMRSQERGNCQTAYRIVVSRGEDVVWDSGRVESSENVSVHYEGAPLCPRTRYTWSVTAWDAAGRKADSAPMWFETGKLSELWSARWITAPFVKTDKTDEGALYLRREFAVKKGVRKARLYLCGLGFNTAFLSGKKVSENLLEPSFTRYDADVLYRVYDVTELLPSGSAALGVVLGNGWFNCFTQDAWNTRQAAWRATPRMICELHVEYEDGASQCIRSDAQWKASFGPITFNAIRNGEWYDARLEQPGWDSCGFDDSAWEPVEVVRSPGGILHAAEVQPVRVMKELQPTRFYRTDEGNWIFDFGQNFAGKVRLTALGPAGTCICLRYCEELTPDGRHVDQSALKGFVRSGEFQTDRYTKKSDDAEVWEPQFVYHGFRYVEIEGLPQQMDEPCVVGLVMHTAFERTGSFTCSDPALETIQRMCHWSSISNCMGVPTDCPHREKNAWTGDLGAAHDQLLFNYDAFLFLQKWMEDLVTSQRPDGAIPCICPSTGWGYHWGNGPDWSMVLTTLPWALYCQTGDKELLRRYYPAICRHFSFMAGMEQDGLLHYGIGDWCAPFEGPALSVNMSSFKAPVALTDTACYYHAADLLSRMSRILGYEDPYRAQCERIRAAFLREFVSPEGEVAGACQTSDGCVVYHHFLEPETEKHLLDTLVSRIEANGWYIDYGILGSKYVLNMLGEYGRADVIYKMITRPDNPGYLYWASQGCTTLAECWNLGGSHNHVMFSDVSAVFYRYFAGIRPCEDAPAYRRVRIAPALDLDISSLSCHLETPHGTLAVAWEHRQDMVEFSVTVPFGTTAELQLPSCVRAEEQGKVLEAGSYTFVWKVDKEES